jgi:hypothetical protein
VGSLYRPIVISVIWKTSFSPTWPSRGNGRNPR